jgi:hypothetical protein
MTRILVEVSFLTTTKVYHSESFGILFEVAKLYLDFVIFEFLILE